MGRYIEGTGDREGGDSGAGMVEYALLIGLIAVLLVTAVVAFRIEVAALIQQGADAFAVAEDLASI